MENSPTPTKKSLLAGTGQSLSLVNYETLWLANKTRKNTLTTYRTAFREFCSLCGFQNSEQFRAAGMAEIIQYRNYLDKERQLKPRSIRSKLAALSDCFNFLKLQGVIDVNPVENVERPRVNDNKGVTPVMTDDQVNLLLSQPDTATLQGARDYAVLCFYFYMGSRISAATSMAIGDYYEDNGFYVLNFEKKGGERQIEPVNPNLQAALNQYLAMRDDKDDKVSPLFQSIRQDKHQKTALSRQQFSRIWAKYRQKAGIDAKFTPHSARATFATLLDRLDEPLQNIQHLLGHANPSTTQAYLHKRTEYKDSPVFRASYGKKLTFKKE